MREDNILFRNIMINDKRADYLGIETQVGLASKLHKHLTLALTLIVCAIVPLEQQQIN
jgi:hypothetical protein